MNLYNIKFTNTWTGNTIMLQCFSDSYESVVWYAQSMKYQLIGDVEYEIIDVSDIVNFGG
jgi:hypothetical protein